MAYTAAGEIGEFPLIEKIASIVEPTLKGATGLLEGIGDDCAAWKCTPGLCEVASTDMLVEDVHFDLLTTPPAHLGGKAIGVNVSDICAMNAFARHALVSIALPPRYPSSLVEELYRGMAHAAERYGVAIVGGDTSSSKSGLLISVTLTGEAPEGMLSFRKGARPGDRVCLTGTLGGSAAGLRVLQREKAVMLEHLEAGEPCPRSLLGELYEYSDAIREHLLPTARLDIVQLFHTLGIVPTSMIDISDGLAQDLGHLCRRSGTGALLEESRIPVNPAARLIADELQEDALSWALRGGEDYQLLFTLPEEACDALSQERDISVIGSITPKEEGLLLRDSSGMQVELTTLSGYRHF